MQVKTMDGTFCKGCPYGNVDRKSTRLNSSHVKISYAVFCLKKKKKKKKKDNKKKKTQHTRRHEN